MHKEDIKMKKYVSPEYEIEQFSIESILTTSIITPTTPDNRNEADKIEF